MIIYVNDARAREKERERERERERDAVGIVVRRK